MNRLALVLGIAGLALGASGCASRPPAVELAVVAREYEFDPSAIEAPAGSAVILTLQNLGQLEHDITIQEIPMVTISVASTPMAGHEMGGAEEAPQLHVAAMMGQTAAITFTPTKPGAYAFACSVPGHKEAGMAGILTISAP